MSLEGKRAVRFQATLGGDYPFSDESQRRKVYRIRSHGTEARCLTVLEPCEDKAFAKSAEASSADRLRVELADGRVQEISLRGLDGDGKHILVEITEAKAGEVIRTENTSE